jgi:hypothetical protein
MVKLLNLCFLVVASSTISLSALAEEAFQMDGIQFKINCSLPGCSISVSNNGKQLDYLNNPVQSYNQTLALVNALELSMVAGKGQPNIVLGKKGTDLFIYDGKNLLGKYQLSGIDPRTHNPLMNPLESTLHLASSLAEMSHANLQSGTDSANNCMDRLHAIRETVDNNNPAINNATQLDKQIETILNGSTVQETKAAPTQ